MDVKSLRRADRWLGVPLCAALTALRKLRDLIVRRPERPLRRILVVKLAEQGATVLAYPALRRAAAMVGRENVFVLVFAENRFILDLLDVVPEKNVIAIRTHGIVRTALDSFRAVLRMRREGIDAAVDFEFFARASAVYTYLSGAGRRAGFHAFAGEASYRGDLMTHRLSFNPHLHASRIFLTLVGALEKPAETLPALDVELPDDEPLPLFRPRPGEEAEVARTVASLLQRGDAPPLVLLNANCSDLLPLRRWPSERYVELARLVLARYPEVAVLFTGAPSEAPQAEALVARIGSERCASIAGKTTLRQLIVLYGLAEVMVTNDSGPAHYATITPIDVVTLFGPETPAAFGSRSPRSHILWAGIPCSPCVNAYNDRQSACRDNLCMQRISVEDVFERVCAVIERRARTHEAAVEIRGEAAEAGRDSARPAALHAPDRLAALREGSAPPAQPETSEPFPSSASRSRSSSR